MFERFAWAGLEADRYSWSAVLHRDSKGGAHVHVLAARVDLETGKSLNVAPPNWERPYAALRNWLNEEHGWSRPDDPERKRVLRPAHRGALESPERDPRQRITGLPGAEDPGGGGHRSRLDGPGVEEGRA